MLGKLADGTMKGAYLSSEASASACRARRWYLEPLLVLFFISMSLSFLCFCFFVWRALVSDLL